MGVKRTSATISEPVFDQIEELVKAGAYRNRSHAIEEGLKKLIAEQKS